MYALPHLLHANLTNSRMQGEFRHSFWAEVYESVLAWYILRPTMVAVINPKLGKFNVTDKGGLNAKEYFDWDIAQPYLILMALSLLGFAAGIFRYFWVPNTDGDTVALNLIWTVYNVMMLGASIAVANEARQVRTSHRVTMKLPATVRTEAGRNYVCTTTDYSDGGVGLVFPAPVAFDLGQHVRLALFRGHQEYEFDAKITLCNADRVGLKFEPMSTQSAIDLIQCTFARADNWVVWGDKRKPDKPLTSLKEIMFLGGSGLAILGRSTRRVLLEHLLARFKGSPRPVENRQSSG
jgi:cellulose synthase (UDP-forming)